MTVPLTRAPASPNRLSGLARWVKHSTRRHHFEITTACPDQRTRNEEEHSDRGARLLFRETELRAGDAMHVLGVWHRSRSSSGLLDVSERRSAAMYTGVRMLKKTRNRAHFVSLLLTPKTPPSPASVLRKSFLGHDIQSGPAFSASQKASWDACLGKCPDHSFPCSLSPKVLHVRTRNPLRKTDSPGHAGAAGNSDHFVRESWEKYCRIRNMR